MSGVGKVISNVASGVSSLFKKPKMPAIAAPTSAASAEIPGRASRSVQEAGRRAKQRRMTDRGRASTNQVDKDRAAPAYINTSLGD